MGKGIIENDHKVPLRDLNGCVERHFGSKPHEFQAIVSSFITHWSQIVSFSRFDERYPADGFMPTLAEKSWEVHVISPKTGEKYVYSGQAAMHALLPLDERNSAGMNLIPKVRRDKKFGKTSYFNIAERVLYKPLLSKGLIKKANELRDFLIEYYEISTGLPAFHENAWRNHLAHTLK
jgi:hypothetical protein